MPANRLAPLAATALMLAGTLPVAADSSQATAAPVAVSTGSNVAISVALELNAAQTVTVDVDVDNSAGQAIWRQQWSGQSFTARQTRSYATTWLVPGGQQAGSYSLVVKAFGGNGQQVFAQGRLAPFTVTSAAVTPTAQPSSTPTPRQTSTPTPARTATATPTSTPTSTLTSTPTSSPTTTSTPTLTPTASSPSGQSMPVGDLPGWRQVFADDFTANVPLGSFPAAVSSSWSAYSDGWLDTSHNGTYMPSQVVSEHDGVMDLYLHTANGLHMVSAPVPRIPGAPGREGGLQYGRYAVRFKSDSLPGYKTAWLLWPDSETWPGDGEIDFPEGSLNGGMCAFMHHQGGTSGASQDAFCTSTPYTGWHTAITEWTPSGVRFTLDGQVIGTSTTAIPNTPLHWVLQTETATDGTVPAASTAGHVLIDWVTAYTPA